MLPPHAVACRIERRGERAHAALARRHGHDTSGDSALTGETHVVEPLAGMLVEAGRGQYGQHPLAVAAEMRACTSASVGGSPVDTRSVSGWSPGRGSWSIFIL